MDFKLVSKKIVLKFLISCLIFIEFAIVIASDKSDKQIEDKIILSRIKTKFPDIYYLYKAEKNLEKGNYKESVIFLKNAEKVSDPFLKKKIRDEINKYSARTTIHERSSNEIKWSQTEKKIGEELKQDENNRSRLLLNQNLMDQLCNLNDDRAIHLVENVIRSRHNRSLIINHILPVCKFEYDRPITLMKLDIQSYIEHKNFEIAIDLLRHIILIHRRTAKRQVAANLYLNLIDLWERVNDKWDFSSFYNYINDVHWAARYRVLVGDYGFALSQVPASIEKIDRYIKNQNLTSKQLKKINALKYEGYYLLADRVYIEQKNFKLAEKILKKSLEWKQRSEVAFAQYNFKLALVYYLQDKFTEAEKTLNNIKEHRYGDLVEEKYLFWKYLTTHKQKKVKESERYFSSLNRKFPFGFYSLLAGTLLERNLTSQKSYITDVKSFQLNSLDIESNEHVADLRPDYFQKKISKGTHLKKFDGILSSRLNEMFVQDHFKSLIERFEYLNRLNLKKWSGQLARVIYFRQRRRLSNLAESIKYMQVLHYSKHFNYSMDLAHNIMIRYKHVAQMNPSQLIFTFPLGFYDLLKDVESKSMHQSLILGIARQESRFDAHAKSHANALGLLQLIVPTARKYSSKNQSLLAEELIKPAVNIRIGLKYINFLLSHYQNSLPMTIAAYNAGEYVVDRWREKRDLSSILVWIELIPFFETRVYVKKVLNNVYIYSSLLENSLIDHKKPLTIAQYLQKNKG